MSFVSFEFVVFFSIVFYSYWFLLKGSAKKQNILLLIVSIAFYYIADFRFLAILLFSISFNFAFGLLISKTLDEMRKRLWLWVGVGTNLLILGYFKYFNFFYASFADLLGVQHSSFSILIPLGISFFTFQTVGYLIDIYNEEIEACKDFIVFSTYIAYFPKISAGPIERAQEFLPQLEIKRVFNPDMAIDGLRQILWGLFTKIVIADNCATIVDPIFNKPSSHSGSTLLLGAFLYAFQVYCDFSSYSNMAVGISKLLGIKLTQNFAMPFFSTNISDYWKKWHISLSRWMMNYLFTPLSFVLRKYKKTGLILSILITFVVVGLWHGANWTYVFFGLLNGLYFIPLILNNTFNKSFIVAQGKSMPSFKEVFSMIRLFLLVMLTMIVFRTENLSGAFHYFSGIMDRSLFTLPKVENSLLISIVIFSILFLIFMEWLNRENEHGLYFYSKTVEKSSVSKVFRSLLYFVLTIAILCFRGTGNDFIYFKF